MSGEVSRVTLFDRRVINIQATFEDATQALIQEKRRGEWRQVYYKHGQPAYHYVRGLPIAINPDHVVSVEPVFKSKVVER